MKKSYLVALGLAVSAILPFVGCDKNKEVVIGGVAPLTGEAATFGVSTKNGYDLAVAEWNAKGGVLGKQVKLVFADDKGDPAEGATVYTKLIEQDKACAIVGTVMSKVSLAGAPICQAAKVPMIATASTNPKVTGVGNFVFRACFIDPFQGTVGAKFAFDDLKAKKAACLFDVGNDYTKGLSEFFKTKFTALGGEVVGFEGHATGTSDFKAQLTKVLAAKPDVLYVSDYYSDVAIIAKQARELGFKGPGRWRRLGFPQARGNRRPGRGRLLLHQPLRQGRQGPHRPGLRQEVHRQVQRGPGRPGGPGL